MQGIFQDFLIWLLKFLAVSAGLLTAARIWTLRRRKKQHRQNPALLPSDRKQRQPLGEENISWGRDAAIAHAARVLLVFAITAGAGLWLLNSQSRPWWAWTGAFAATFATAALCSVWLRHARQHRLGLTEIRGLADDLELAALRIPMEPDLETALQTAAAQNHLHGTDCRRQVSGQSRTSQMERDLGRVSREFASRFAELAGRASVDAVDLRTLADGVHQELSKQAADQVRRVSSWAKYPLLMGTLPVVCFLLVAPLTESALDQITTATAQSQDANPHAAQAAAGPRITPVLLLPEEQAPSQTVSRDGIALPAR